MARPSFNKRIGSINTVLSSLNVKMSRGLPSIEKSKEIPHLYQTLAEEEGVEFLNAGEFIESSHIDGVHLDEIACKKIGNVIAEKVKLILSN